MKKFGTFFILLVCVFVCFAMSEEGSIEEGVSAINFQHEKTNGILKRFEEIGKIYRCSKHEKLMGEYLMNWAIENDFQVNQDEVGNVVIKVPGNSCKNKPVVVIQGHQDMVCVKTEESNHDFITDPIQFVFDDEWLSAKDTSLGADNGIGIAIAMELALDDSIKRPPMELLFTVDEETGLTGALSLQPGFIEGKILLNIDSEVEGHFTVGCAGGITSYLNLSLEYDSIPSDYVLMKVVADNMTGGHSGVDIHKGKANAIKVLARTLQELAAVSDIRVGNIKGGTVSNAIPRAAKADIFFPSLDEEKMRSVISEINDLIKNEYLSVDPDLSITMIELPNGSMNEATTSDSTKKVIDFIIALPHGVDAMSANIENLVETSNNLAIVKMEDGQLQIITNQRSSLMAKLDEITNRIEEIARQFGGEGTSSNGYPSWEPNMDSSIMKICTETYENLFGKEPIVEVIHAGLECGVIDNTYPGMDMISFGPTIENAHTTDERVHIGSIGLIWDFMAQLLQEIRPLDDPDGTHGHHGHHGHDGDK